MAAAASPPPAAPPGLGPPRPPIPPPGPGGGPTGGSTRGSTGGSTRGSSGGSSGVGVGGAGARPGRPAAARRGRPAPGHRRSRAGPVHAAAAAAAARPPDVGMAGVVTHPHLVGQVRPDRRGPPPDRLHLAQRPGRLVPEQASDLPGIQPEPSGPGLRNRSVVAACASDSPWDRPCSSLVAPVVPDASWDARPASRPCRPRTAAMTCRNSVPDPVVGSMNASGSDDRSAASRVTHSPGRRARWGAAGLIPSRRRRRRRRRARGRRAPGGRRPRRGPRRRRTRGLRGQRHRRGDRP